MILLLLSPFFTLYSSPQPFFLNILDKGTLYTPVKVLTVTPFTRENRGPYPKNIPKKNTVKFTPTQVEAIRSGTNPGLTMVVGPPGTGKTDVAVQIISNLYHNFPGTFIF